jgi:transcriptional regulator with XRE-family HTH domain
VSDGCDRVAVRRVLRVAARLDGTIEARRISTTLGADVRTRRKQLGWSQAELGRRIGLSQPRESMIERGLGVGEPFDVWIVIGIALGQPLAVAFSRPMRPEDGLADAGHLQIQEYLLEIGRRNGRRGSFERPTRPSDPAQSVDVLQIDAKNDCLVVQEAWNRIGDLGAAARSSDRKVAELERQGQMGRVALCWVVRDSAANQAIVRRYPEVIGARFAGSSRGWVDALERGRTPPSEPGIIWFDAGRRRLRPMRLRRRVPARH